MHGTYSRAPVWVPSLRRRQPGSIEPHQSGEGLRHPVGNHRHGAQHDPDLQQRHRHLLRAPNSDSTLILLHSTDSVEKQGRRVAVVPRASWRTGRISGSARSFVDIFCFCFFIYVKDAGLGRRRGELIWYSDTWSRKGCWVFKPRKQQMDRSSLLAVPHNAALDLRFSLTIWVRLLPGCALWLTACTGGSKWMWGEKEEVP